MAENGRDPAHLALLADPGVANRLTDLGCDWKPVDRQACASLLFKRSADHSPRIAGLIGGASAGKSTLFNTLVRAEVSRISTVAHETVGPIAACHQNTIERVNDWIDNGRLFPGFNRMPANADGPSTGAVESILLSPHAIDVLARTIVVDLPDVTSRQSLDEGDLSACLLPWFDVLIVVVDEERWFDVTVFDATVAHARPFTPAVFAMFNANEGGGDLNDDDRRRLAEHASRHQFDGHAFSVYQPGTGYRPLHEDARSQVLDWMDRCPPATARSAALTSYVRDRCADLVRVNVERARQFDDMARHAEKEKRSAASETRLTFDLLTDEERGLLGVGHRWMPLHGLVRTIGNRWGRFGRRTPSDGITFDKRVDDLAGVLRRNIEHRFHSVADRLQRLILNSAYWGDHPPDWRPVWEMPAFDEHEWARRIHAHIDAWKEEATRNARRSDTTVLSFGLPLLMADILFLGGAGVTFMSVAAWAAGMVAGKGLVQSLQGSRAFQDYRATVDAYQAFIRESLDDQWSRNVAIMPRRHLPIQDPVLQAMMTLAASRTVSP